MAGYPTNIDGEFLRAHAKQKKYANSADADIITTSAKAYLAALNKIIR